jgi:hypothetical protein
MFHVAVLACTQDLWCDVPHLYAGLSHRRGGYALVDRLHACVTTNWHLYRSPIWYSCAETRGISCAGAVRSAASHGEGRIKWGRFGLIFGR